ncbi:MAG: Gfo/Idh/MocA family oxidoreductase [Kiritimatiellia bacterium]|nr:Gfo/Idh/MocA family oxidoreductase [Kiritimatiellia bacterium]
MIGIGIIGCGNIGKKRAAHLADARLVACADIRRDAAEALAAASPGAAVVPEWTDLIRRTDVQAVIVSTTNDILCEATLAALEAGKSVLVEKPAGRSVGELDRMIEAEQRTGGRVRVGFNHRYHPALLKARDLVDAGDLGPLMFIRGRYGHGGRVGYDREWRADPVRSGGGELMDQGVHLIDLSRWFLGDFSEIGGFARTYFWDMPVDDNAFLLLQTPGRQTAMLHVSCTEWKNLFSLEIYGRDGKLHVEGLGGSYGVERLSFYRMRPEMGPPETTIWEYPGADLSWKTEFAAFLEDLRLHRSPDPGLREARAALDVVRRIYAGDIP